MKQKIIFLTMIATLVCLARKKEKHNLTEYIGKADLIIHGLEKKMKNTPSTDTEV